MEYKVRSYPLFSDCGLNCGLCPRYYTDGASRCPGCGQGESCVGVVTHFFTISACQK